MLDLYVTSKWMRASQVVLVEEPAWQRRRCKRYRFSPWVEKIPLEKEIETHSSLLAWRIPWKEKPGGLPTTGLQRLRHKWSDLACTDERKSRKKDIFYLLLSSAFLHVKLAKIQNFYKLSVNVEGKSHCKWNISITFLKGKLVVRSIRLICL